MSSIEEILNADDSEDEEFGGAIDLENLLHSRDEYDDDHFTTAIDIRDCVPLALDTRPVTSIKRTFEVREQHDEQHDVDATIRDERAAEQQLPNDEDDEEFPLEENENRSMVEHKLSGLRDADVREQQFLAAGKRDSLSALQSKRNSAALLNHSNIRCDELVKVSDQLHRNAAYKQHGPGIATAMTVTDSFLAVGTAKGLIILFDHTEEIRQVLGSNLPLGARPTVAVTALDAPKSDFGGAVRGVEGLLVCGYASGEVALWDVAKGSIVKVINDLHTCSISTVSVLEAVSEGFTTLSGAGAGVLGEHVLPLPAGWKAAGARDGTSATEAASDFTRYVSSAASAGLSGVSLVVITSDSSGVMYKTRLSKTLWSATFTSESECLLDASTGPLSGVATLGPLLRSVDASAGEDGLLSCKYLVAHRTTRMLAINVGASQTWIVQTHPKIKIVYKWDAPSGVDGLSRELAWTWAQEASTPEGDEYRDWQPVLARCWGEDVQSLVLRTTVSPLSKPQVTPAVSGTAGAPPASSSAFGAFSSLLSAARATASAPEPEPRTYTSKFSAGYRRSFPGQKVLTLRWTSSRELVILTTSDVTIANPQLQTVEQLSLAPSMSMDLSSYYNRMVESASAAAAADHASVAPSQLLCDVCDHKLYAVVQDTALRVFTQSCFELAEKLIGRAQWLEALALIIENVRKVAEDSASPSAGGEVDSYIVRYADLAVKHAAVPAHAQGGDAAVQARNHFHLVAGVCIEYCVACVRLEVLFAQVYHIFRSAQQHQAFLEALEPFILSREVTSLPPAVIAEFCEYAQRSQRLPSIERCVAYFEIANLDMNFITKFLYQNRMYSGFLYAFSNGLSDFPGAFQVVFSFMLLPDEAEGGNSGEAVLDGATAVAEIGYKLLLFLSYSFEGKVFPRGDPLTAQRQDTVALQLLDLVTSPDLRPMQTFFSAQSPAGLSKLSAALGPYPYLSKLAAADRDALLAVLRMGVETLQRLHSSTPAGQEGDSTVATAVPTLLDRMRAFCELQDVQGGMQRMFYDEFLAVVAACPFKLSQPFSEAVVQHVAARDNSERDALEARLTELLEHQVRAAGYSHCAALRRTLEHHNFWIASLAAARSATSAEKEEVLHEQAYADAIKHYVELAKTAHPHSTTAPAAFRYVENVFAALESVFPISDRKKHSDALCKEVVAAVLALAHLDLGLTKQLVKARLSSHLQEVIANTTQEPRVRYQLLDALLWSPEDLLATRVALLQTCFSSQDVLVYVSDLATYEPGKMLSFLQSFESHYPLDECLVICRQKGLSEAVAYLMERAGQALDALVMLLKDFSTRLKQVRRDVDAQLRAELAAQAAAAKANVRVGPQDAELHVVSTILSKQGAERSHAARRLPGYAVLLSIMNCVADLCARNSKEDGSGMWLMAFDHLLMERRT
jgi:hypothetical protein